MTRYGILAVAVLTFGFSTGAKNSPSNQAGASAQTQTSTSATASAGISRPSQNSTAQKSPSKSASASASNGTSTSANAGGGSLDLASGTTIQAVLATPLDAKRNKPGDPVIAKTTQDVKQDGKVVLKKGSELKGHVTQAHARMSHNAQSSLGIVFDSAVPKNGQPMPVNLSIQALAGAQNQVATSLGDNRAMLDSTGEGGFTGAATPAGSGLVRGVGGTVAGVANTAGGVTGNVGQTAGGTMGAATHSVASTGSTGGLNAAGQLISNSTGVFNLRGLNLTSAANNGTQASVVNSTTQNVHLASGTQMVLQVIGH
jgi:hypothetical protein